jgi:hypothetical protein
MLIEREQRVIDVVAVVSVEQCELLLAVGDEVGRVEVENDPNAPLGTARFRAQSFDP